jgi:hypothetical protein
MMADMVDKLWGLGGGCEEAFCKRSARSRHAHRFKPGLKIFQPGNESGKWIN